MPSTYTGNKKLCPVFFFKSTLYQYQNSNKSQFKNLFINHARLKDEITIFGSLQHFET